MICVAGQVEAPVNCDRHGTHHYCDTCHGYFGVPHDGIHVGPNRHPTWTSATYGCVCTPCRIERDRSGS